MTLASAGDSERWLILTEATRLSAQAVDLHLIGRNMGDPWAGLFTRGASAVAREGAELRAQLDRAKRDRPPRSGRSR